MSFIRRLFCKHEYRLYRIIYGDEIIGRNYKRYELCCEKCGNRKYSQSNPTQYH